VLLAVSKSKIEGLFGQDCHTATCFGGVGYEGLSPTKTVRRAPSLLPAVLVPNRCRSEDQEHDQRPNMPVRSSSLPSCQRRSVRWIPAVARILPSGEKARRRTGPACPRNTAFSLPVAASQSRTVWSCPEEASVLPLGVYATEKRRSVCPFRTF